MDKSYRPTKYSSEKSKIILKHSDFSLLGINGTAFSILMQSQQIKQTQQPSSNNVTFNKCWLCEQPSETMPCNFCERRVCEMCVRQCDRCFGVFCSCCATVKYDQHEDRALCLGCNSEEFKRRRVKAVPVHRVWRG